MKSKIFDKLKWSERDKKTNENFNISKSKHPIERERQKQNCCAVFDGKVTVSSVLNKI